MAINITMPALSPTMEEGTLAKWLVKEGDTVSSGDIIAEIETDKATMEVPSSDAGIVKSVEIKVGDKVSEGDLILKIEAVSEDSSESEQELHSRRIQGTT